MSFIESDISVIYGGLDSNRIMGSKYRFVEVIIIFIVNRLIILLLINDMDSVFLYIIVILFHLI